MPKIKKIFCTLLFLFSLQVGIGQALVYDPTASVNAAKQFAELVDSKTQNSFFTAKNLELLADGSLKMGDMIGQLNEINDLYKTLNPYLQGAVVLKRVYEDYNQILSSANNLYTQSASANYINASQRDQLVSLTSNILRRSGEDLSKIKEVLSTSFKMSDAERLKALAEIETNLSKSLTDLNSGHYFADQLKEKYTKKSQDSALAASDSILTKKLFAEPIMSKRLVYMPSLAGYYDPTTRQMIPLDSSASKVSLPNIEQMRNNFNLRATNGSSADIGDYTRLFSASGGSRQAEIIIGLFIVLNTLMGVATVMGVKLIKAPGFEDEVNKIFLNKASSWFWSTLIFTFLFGILRFLF
jgi:hypothetical protein